MLKLIVHPILLVVCTLFFSGCIADTRQAPEVPDAIQVSAAEQFTRSMLAEGVQIYRCAADEKDASKVQWAFVAPEAVLHDQQHNEVATHYAGPTWEANDGSKVIAEVKARMDAPSNDTIPWLLLNAKMTEGTGSFGTVTSIQRLNTTGGQAPQEGCDATHVDAEARVPYTAVYAFYTAR